MLVPAIFEIFRDRQNASALLEPFSTCSQLCRPTVERGSKLMALHFRPPRDVGEAFTS